VSTDEETFAIMTEMNENTRRLVDAGMQFLDEATKALQRNAARIKRQHSTAKAPAPIATKLHGFSRVIAAHVDAVAQRLQPSDRDRLLAIAPGFLHGVGASEPDVVDIVLALLQMSPDFASLWLRAHLDLIERRFAS
jgi:hypothetical protein